MWDKQSIQTEVNCGLHW